ncbi:MAG: zf-HC2 domain-containing protein [Acidobacteriota bacterium]|nr:MAG: zf-HC2 domain-containing protein [Acidobacteriota bacterium]
MSHAHQPGSEHCRELLARLSDYIDGELAAEFCEQIELHLADCPPCAAFLSSLERTVAWLGDLSEESLSNDLREDLERCLAGIRSQQRN